MDENDVVTNDLLNECFVPAAGIPLQVDVESIDLHYFDVLDVGGNNVECTTSSCTMFGRSWWDSAMDECNLNGLLENVADCNNEDFAPKYRNYSPIVV